MNRTAEPYLKVSRVVNGFAGARVLQVAVELDVFTKLADEGKTAAQLSTLIQVHPGALELVLNALTAMGFLHKEAEVFQATPISHTYLSGSGPRYIGHLILHLARRWDDWGKLVEAIRSGRPVRKPDMFQDSPQELELFIRGLHELALARGDARWLARAIPLKRCRKLVDLGGGPGTYASLFCRANRQLQATVLDLPGTLKVTRKLLRDFDITGRVSTLSCDYRTEKIKGGPYDVALVSNILHSEDEVTNLALLRNIHEALVPGGILIVKDHVMSPDHTQPESGALFALELLLGTRGRTYSFAQIADWMQRAGFQDMVEVPLGAPADDVSVVLALRPGAHLMAVLPKSAAVVEKHKEPPVAMFDADVEPRLPEPARSPKPAPGGRAEPEAAQEKMPAGPRAAPAPPGRNSKRKVANRRAGQSLRTAQPSRSPKAADPGRTRRPRPRPRPRTRP